MRYRPHDLLFPARPDAFDSADARPAWLDAAGLRAAPLVVRRAGDCSGRGRIPVGARGIDRNERCAGHLAPQDVASCVTPEMLARRLLAPAADRDRFAGEAAGLPCISALLSLAPRLQALGLAWGPAGGVAFWLASGLPVLRPSSDLDLLVRAPAPLASATMAALCALQDHAASRVDIQVDTGDGGFALMEYARGGKVLLKTDRGPQLLADPWQARETA